MRIYRLVKFKKIVSKKLSKSTFSIQVLSTPVCAVTVIGQQVEDLPDDDCFILVNHKIPHLLILLIQRGDQDDQAVACGR